MKFFDALRQQFIDLCEIPELYAGIATGSIEIDIISLGSCYYGFKINCSDSSLAHQMSLQEEVFIEAMYRSNLVETYITCKNQFVQLFPNPLFLLVSMNTEDIAVEEEQQVERVFFLTGRRTVPNSERVRKTILAKSRACLKGESVLENSSMGQKHIPAHLSKCRPEIRAPVCSRTKCQLQLGVFSMATSGKKRTWEKQLLCCPIED